MPLQPLNQRKTSRRPVRRAAAVVFGERGLPIPCVIWDISDGGARLAVAHSLATLPNNFTLVLCKNGLVQRKCEIVWTDARFVGVKFVDPDSRPGAHVSARSYA